MTLSTNKIDIADPSNRLVALIDDFNGSKNLTGTLNKYANQWLALQGECIEAAQAGTLVLKNTHGAPFRREWYWPVNHLSVSRQFTIILDRAVQEQKGVVINSPNKSRDKRSRDAVVQIAYPVSLSSTTIAVAAFTIRPTGEEQLQRAMRQLQWGMVWLQKFLLLPPNGQDSSIATDKADQFRQVFDLLNSTLNSSRGTDAATALSTEMATLLRCDRVTIGLLERSKIHILALSHSAEHRQNTNIIRAITAALEEGTDQRETILFPPLETPPGIILRAHTELAEKYGCGSLLTIPFLNSEGLAYGGILFERSGKEPFAEKTVILCEAVASLTGPVLRDKQHHDLSLFRKSLERGNQHLKNISGPGNPGKKLAGIATLLFLLFLVVAKGEFQIPAKLTLSGEIQRTIIAPFPGYVSTSLHSAGDHVEQDETIASLDTTDLTLEQLQWASRKKQADLEYQKAIAGNLTADAKIIMEQRKQAEIQLSLLEQKRKRMTITAPFSGLLVKGDLSQSIGAPVERGEALFELVPDNAFRLLLDVDERDIDFVAAGQDGTLVFNALPQHQLAFTVAKITPVSTPSNGQNTFRVEGKLLQTSDRLRPGMTGYAKIHIARKSLIWIWSRSIINRIKLWFWSSLW